VYRVEVDEASADATDPDSLAAATREAVLSTVDADEVANAEITVTITESSEIDISLEPDAGIEEVRASLEEELCFSTDSCTVKHIDAVLAGRRRRLQVERASLDMYRLDRTYADTADVTSAADASLPAGAELESTRTLSLAAEATLTGVDAEVDDAAVGESVAESLGTTQIEVTSATLFPPPSTPSPPPPPPPPPPLEEPGTGGGSSGIPVYIIAAAAGGGGAALCLALLGVYCYRRRKGKAARERAPSGRHDDEDVKPPPTRSTSPSSQKSSPVAERPPE